MKKPSATQVATIAALRNVTPTVREITLRLSQPVVWQAGAHIQVQLRIQGGGIERHYSLIPCEQADCIRIAVKRAQPGRGGSQAMWRLVVGDSLAISAPINQFSLDLQAPAYLLIAGGIGITPLLSMAKALKARQAKVSMIFAASSAQEFAYRDVLQALLGDDVQWIEGAGLNAQAAIADLPQTAQVYVCGPSGLLAAVHQAWGAAGRSPSLLRFENFGAGSNQDAAFEVRLPRHDLRFAVQHSASLLDAIEQQGVQAMFGCRRGECGLCALSVLKLDGEIEHRDVFLSTHEKQSNTQICICVSRVRGSITLDSAFRADDFLKSHPAPQH
jgi:ferredoxin-NADP reductase